MSIPIPRIFWPVTIDATNNKLRFRAESNDVGGGLTTYDATVASGTYLTPETLAQAVVDGIYASTFGTADDGGASYALTASGLLTLTLDGLTPTATIFYWSYSAATTALAALLGYPATTQTVTVSAEGAPSATFPASAQMRHLWTPDLPVRSDLVRAFSAAASVSETVAGQNLLVRWDDPDNSEERRVVFAYLPPQKIFEAEATGALANQALQIFWRGQGVARFRYSPDRASPTTGAQDYYLAAESVRAFAPTRMFDTLERYQIELVMRRWHL